MPRPDSKLDVVIIGAGAAGIAAARALHEKGVRQRTLFFAGEATGTGGSTGTVDGGDWHRAPRGKTVTARRVNAVAL